MHISYLAGLKERVKAQKGKAASGEELQSVTADAEELAKIEAMVRGPCTPLPPGAVRMPPLTAPVSHSTKKRCQRARRR